ncbi:MAG: hypothetical protein AAFN30_20270, partial [Actinomycetota bacterium]
MTTTTTEPRDTTTPELREQAPTALAVRDIAPFALSLVPFSLAIGSAAAATGLAPAEAAGAAVFLLAGGAQLAAIEQQPGVDQGDGAENHQGPGTTRQQLDGGQLGPTGQEEHRRPGGLGGRQAGGGRSRA